jgi:hypothetical protein
MTTVISDVLFQMYYLTPDAEQKEIDISNREADFEACISVDNFYIKELRFYFPRRLSVVMAANFLGLEEPEVSDEEIRSTLLETCNMLAGNFLGELEQSSSWVLGLPRAGTRQKPTETSECCGFVNYQEQPLEYEVVGDFKS